MVLIPKKMGFAGDFQAQMELGEARLARVGCHRKGVARLAAWGLHHQKLRIWHDLTIKDGGFAQKKQKKRFKNDQKWRINQSHNGFGILGWKSGIRQSKLKVTYMSHGEEKTKHNNVSMGIMCRVWEASGWVSMLNTTPCKRLRCLRVIGLYGVLFWHYHA